MDRAAMDQLLAAIDSLKGSRVLVLGDLMLDRYTWGDAERVSPEAPVIVLRAHRQEDRLGGAAAVAHLLRALEAHVSCAGVLGVDVAGIRIRELLHQAGILDRLVVGDEERASTIKERFIGVANGRHADQILRVDHETRESIPRAIEEMLLSLLISSVRESDSVVISDYGKGVCTERLCQEVISEARSAGVPVIVDPSRTPEFGRYRRATAITPNRDEAMLATGSRIACVGDALSAAQSLCHDLNLDMAIITLDRDGICMAGRNDIGRHFGIKPRSVYDITGAGDMVLAVLGTTFASGLSPEVGVQLANLAAGLEVQRMGVAVVSLDELRQECLATQASFARKIISLSELESRVQGHRADGRTIALANGCFDLLHCGHLRYLSEAATLADILVVGVNSDASVRRLKGSQRPIIGQSDRAAMLGALECVDHVVIFDDDTPHSILQTVRPDVLVKGGNYSHDQVIGRDLVEAYGGKVCLTSHVDGISTTLVIGSLMLRDDVQRKRTRSYKSQPRVL